MMSNTNIEKYYWYCEKIAREFVGYYFGIEYINDSFWVGDRVGELLSISDFFFEMHDVVEFVKNKIDPDSLIDWYYQWTDSNNDKKINSTNWKYKK